MIDAVIKDAMMLRAVQTLNSKELKAKDMNLPQWYLSMWEKYKADLLKITDVVVADAGFSCHTFVEGLRGIGFDLVSPFCSDLSSIIFKVPKSGKRGRPKEVDGRIDFENPDLSRMQKLDIDPSL